MPLKKKSTVYICLKGVVMTMEEPAVWDFPLHVDGKMSKYEEVIISLHCIHIGNNFIQIQQKT